MHSLRVAVGVYGRGETRKIVEHQCTAGVERVVQTAELRA